jgi:hypothetical protein
VSTSGGPGDESARRAPPLAPNYGKPIIPWQLKTLYLLLAVLGLAVPYYFLGTFLLEHGLNVRLLVQQLFANSISTFFAVDVLISSVVFWFFVYQEGARHNIPHAWLFILANLFVGVSFALPLFLYFRQARLEAEGGIK